MTPRPQTVAKEPKACDSPGLRGVQGGGAAFTSSETNVLIESFRHARTDMSLLASRGGLELLSSRKSVLLVSLQGDRYLSGESCVTSVTAPSCAGCVALRWNFLILPPAPFPTQVPPPSQDGAEDGWGRGGGARETSSTQSTPEAPLIITCRVAATATLLPAHSGGGGISMVRGHHP